MTPRHPIRPSAPGEFRPEKFRTKSTFRDYLIYGLVLIGVVALIGAGVYYFTRSPRDKERLHTKFETFFTPKSEPPPRRISERASPELDELDGREPAAKTPPPPAKTPPPKQDTATAYAGGGPNRVIPSDTPNAPKPGPAFLRFVQALKVSSVVPGTSAKAMLNGRLHNADDIIDRDLGITFISVDGDKKWLVLRDKTGAELRLTY